MKEILLNQWVVGVGTAIIAGIVLYFLFGNKKTNSKKKKSIDIKKSPIKGNVVLGNHNIIGNQNEEFYPEISFHIIGPFENGAVGLEIYNSGTEDVENIQIIAGWYQNNEYLKTEKQERVISSFMNENDDPVLIRPSSSLGILRKGEKKIALGIPNTAIKKKVAIRIKCAGLKSKKIFNQKRELETVRDYPKTNEIDVFEKQRLKMDENERRNYLNSSK